MAFPALTQRTAIVTVNRLWGMPICHYKQCTACTARPMSTMDTSPACLSVPPTAHIHAVHINMTLQTELANDSLRLAGTDVNNQAKLTDIVVFGHLSVFTVYWQFTAAYKDDCSKVAELKQQISQKILLRSTLTKCHCANDTLSLVLKLWLNRIYSFGDFAIFMLSGFRLKLPIYIAVSSTHPR